MKRLSSIGGTWLLMLSFVFICCSCENEAPLEPRVVGVRTADLVTAADWEAAVAFDDDGDGFSSATGFGPVDCNDSFDFGRPFGEYCAAWDSIVFDPASGVQVGDFSLVHADSQLNIYYIKGIDWVNNPDTHGKSFGHERSADLFEWQEIGDILTTATGSDWDDDHIWAPSVVRHPVEGRYYMFYTGVTNAEPDVALHTERIGMAWSDDLDVWNRINGNACSGTSGPGCVWDCDLPWTTWGDGGSWDDQCRDPFVFRDEAARAWYMVYSTRRASDGKMVIGLARSALLIDWVDYGQIDVTAGAKVESSHIYHHDGFWYLFWTYNYYGGIKYSWTADLENGPWAAPQVVPGSVLGSHLASEVLEINGLIHYAYIHNISYNVRFKTLRIEADHSLVFEPVPELGCVFVGAAAVHPGAPDIVNGFDDNCNGVIDEGIGDCANDQDGDFYGDPPDIFCLSLVPDCDDTRPWIFPGAPEICRNHRDDNCNGVIDDPQRCRLEKVLIERESPQAD